MNHSNLNLYYIFYMVAESGNISKAAKRLYISQPAISKAISKLEASLETSLFVRSSRGVKLTVEGELLYRQAELAFHTIEKGEHQIKKTSQQGITTLSIGVSSTLCKYVLLPKLPEFISSNPNVKLSISCQSTNDTIEALENDLIDIGLIGEPQKSIPLKFIPICEITDIFVTTSQYLKQLILDNQEVSLKSGTLLLLDKKNSTRQYVDRYLLNHHLEAGALLEVSTMDLLIEFAKIGLGIACVISNFVENELKDKTLIEFPMPNPIPSRKIGLAFKEKANPIYAMIAFMKLFFPDGSYFE